MSLPFTATISAQPGPQTEFLRTAADICIYGGAAGGGKTVGLILEPLRHVGRVANFTAVFFRRTTPQITNPGGLWDESRTFYPRLGGIPHLGMREWRWPRAGKIKFSHLQFETTVHDWQGAQITLICFDELTHFTAHQFFYMVSRNRSTCGVRPYIRATCNPDADSWVADFLAWWIDPESGLPIPERAGVLRYYIRVAEKLVWADKPEELMRDLPRPEDLPPGIDPPRPISVTFIPAKVFDNPVLLRVNPEYFTWLLSLPLLERERLLGGNWKIRPSAGLYFKREWCAVVDEVPADLNIVRYWDLAATEKTEFNDPIGRSASSSAAIRAAATGCWIWCAGGPTRAMSTDCCSIPPRRTASGSASDSARIRGRPARARRFTWCAHSVPSPWWRLPRAATSSRGSGHSVRSAAPAM
jgi:Terminase large subunit, T4likevirus-type, N-terminal